MLAALNFDIYFCNYQIHTVIKKHKDKQDIIIHLPHIGKVVDFSTVCLSWMKDKQIYIEEHHCAEFKSDIFSKDGSLQQYLIQNNLMEVNASVLKSVNKKAEVMKKKIDYRINMDIKNEERKLRMIMKGKENVLRNNLQIKERQKSRELRQLTASQC